MSCDLCIEDGKKCVECRDSLISDVARRAEGKRRHRKGFKDSKQWKCKLCTCCTSIDIAITYMNCPANMYVGHIISAAMGGEHCIKNLKYFVKQS